MQNPENLSDEQKMSQLMDGEWHELNPSECVAKLCADEALRAKWARYHLIRDALKNESAGVDQGLAARICSAIADEPSYSNITPFSAVDSTQTGNSGNDSDVSGQAASSAQNSTDDQTDSMVAAMPADVLANTPESTSDVNADGHAEKSDSRRSSLFNTGIAGFALAASVALVTVVGLNLYDSVTTVPVTTVAENSAPKAAVSDSANGALTLQVSTLNESDNTNAFSQQVDGAPLPEVELVSNTGRAYWVSPESTERVPDEQRLNMMLSRHLENSPTSGREGLLSYSRLVSYDESVQER